MPAITTWRSSRRRSRPWSRAPRGDRSAAARPASRSRSRSSCLTAPRYEVLIHPDRSAPARADGLEDGCSRVSPGHRSAPAPAGPSPGTTAAGSTTWSTTACGGRSAGHGEPPVGQQDHPRVAGRQLRRLIEVAQRLEAKWLRPLLRRAQPRSPRPRGHARGSGQRADGRKLLGLSAPEPAARAEPGAVPARPADNELTLYTSYLRVSDNRIYCRTGRGDSQTRRVDGGSPGGGRPGPSSGAQT